ncbi:MAG: hypothetical protein M0003_08135 [Acidithiobacillus sp.]|nr:hypothetical protein [Acidithiobacillus sp.]
MDLRDLFGVEAHGVQPSCTRRLRRSTADMAAKSSPQPSQYRNLAAQKRLLLLRERGHVRRTPVIRAMLTKGPGWRHGVRA